MASIASSFLRTKYIQVVIFLLAFAIMRWLWMNAFFSGFNGGYDHLAGLLGNSGLADMLRRVPFHSWSICLSALTHPVFILMMIASVLPFVLQKKYFSEAEIGFTKAELFFFSAIAFIIAWELITYDYNYYLGSAFYFDRFLLLTLALLIYRWPKLIILFVAFALVYRAQFNYPVDGFPMFDKRLLFDVLMCAGVWQYVRLLLPGEKIPVLFFVLIIVAAGYFASGAKKIFISPHGYEWLLYNEPLDLFNNVHARGWLACANESLVRKFQVALENSGALFQWFVLSVELMAIFLLTKKRWTIILLSAFVVMHTGIFLFASMLFWKWIAVDILLLVLLWKRPDEFIDSFSDRRLKWLAAGAIALSFFWLRPVTIGWFDTPVNKFYTYEIVDETGTVYQLDKNEMNPYHQWFQYDQFDFLSPQATPELSGFGYTSDYYLANALWQTDSTMEGIVAPVNYDKQKKAQFDLFVQQYFRNKNARVNNNMFLPSLAPPDHLHTSVCVDSLSRQGRTKAFRVILNITWTSENETRWLVREVIDEVNIPD